jgi:transcriptional regulator
MYRPPAFAVDDLTWLHAAIRTYPLATIAMAKDGLVRFAYAPVILDNSRGDLGTLRFHLARNNPLVAANDATLSFSFRGPDAYVSPDWYETKGLVPTWNYIAVEATGIARRIVGAELRQLLVDLTDAEEDQLHPKPAWTIDKVPQERLSQLVTSIAGFAVPLDTLQGKFKLSQDKRLEDVTGVIAGLEERNTPQSNAVARAMRDVSLNVSIKGR